MDAQVVLQNYGRTVWPKLQDTRRPELGFLLPEKLVRREFVLVDEETGKIWLDPEEVLTTDGDPELENRLAKLLHLGVLYHSDWGDISDRTNMASAFKDLWHQLKDVPEGHVTKSIEDIEFLLQNRDIANAPHGQRHYLNYTHEDLLVCLNDIRESRKFQKLLDFGIKYIRNDQILRELYRDWSTE